jgi:hypothetical protein
LAGIAGVEVSSIKVEGLALSPQPQQDLHPFVGVAIGLEVKLKPFIRRGDGSAKRDGDVGITLEVMQDAPQVDVIPLASGDGELDPCQQDSGAAPSVGRGLRCSSTHGGISAPGSNKICPA